MQLSNQPMTLMGSVSHLDVKRKSFRLDCRDGSRVLVFVSRETKFVHLKNLDELERDRIRIPSSFKADDPDPESSFHGSSSRGICASAGSSWSRASAVRGMTGSTCGARRARSTGKEKVKAQRIKRGSTCGARRARSTGKEKVKAQRIKRGSTCGARRARSTCSIRGRAGSP